MCGYGHPSQVKDVQAYMEDKITSDETTTMLSSFDLKYSLFCISIVSSPNLSRV